MFGLKESNIKENKIMINKDEVGTWCLDDS